MRFPSADARHPVRLLACALLLAAAAWCAGCGDDSVAPDADVDVVDDGTAEVPPDAEPEVDVALDVEVDAPPDVEVDVDVPADADGADDGDGGPPWRECVPAVGTGTGLTLRGTVLTPEVELPDGEVLIDLSTGLIACVAEDCSGRPEAVDGTVICTDGVIAPGLIDVHDHAGQSILPRMQHGTTLYLSRYDWQGSGTYISFVEPYRTLQASLQCEMTKYGEVRMALGGATSIQGTEGASACIAPLLRNLDVSAIHGLTGWEMEERVSRIANLSDSAAETIRNRLADGSFDAFVPHIGEGVDEASRAEFDRLNALGLIVPQTSVIHGTAGGTTELGRLAAVGAGLIWSPRSNADLYGMTTDVALARHLGVSIAVGPDWGPSGSWSIPDELKCVDQLDAAYYDEQWTDRELVEMVTSVPADQLRLHGRIGRLAEGLHGDVTVFQGDRRRPYRTVIDASPADVLLVLRDGRLLAGDELLATPLAGPYCEPLDACGAPKTLCLKTTEDATDRGHQTFADLDRILRAALDTARRADPAWDPADPAATYQYELAPLVECDVPAPCRLGRSGIPGVPTAEDGDGDGAPDATDRCPLVFDPYQPDLDGDGLGDVCDPCPFDAGATRCPPPDPLDIDRDGRDDAVDNCVRVPNPDQLDTDHDGVGDACELTPITIYDIQDLTRPLHPAEGSVVLVNRVTVTAVYPTRGFWIQEAAGGPFSGIYVYLGAAPGVAVGDVVEVAGIYAEYSGVSEIEDGVVVRLTGGPPPAAAPVAPADVVTGGALAEAYEGVLISVGPVTVTSANPDAPSDFGEFAVTAGLRVDDALYAIVPDPAVGITFTRLTGVLHYGYDNTKLLPRNAADVVP